MDYIVKRRARPIPNLKSMNAGPQTFIKLGDEIVRFSRTNLRRCLERVVAGEKVDLKRYGTVKQEVKPKWDLTKLTPELAETVLEQINQTEREEEDDRNRAKAIRKHRNSAGGAPNENGV